MYYYKPEDEKLPEELPLEEPAAVEEAEAPVPPALEPVSLSDELDLLLLEGGELYAECSIEQFNEVFVKYRPQRRACKLELSWTDGVLHASARL